MTVKPDIVRIDDFGVARPTDRGSVARFKTAKGSYRLLPSPPRFLLLERLTDGGQPLHLRLSGEISAPGMLCDICSLLAQASWRGELIVWSPAGARSVFFEEGHVLGAQSTAAGERLGEILHKLGALTPEQILAIADKTTPERRFGETAVDLGFLPREGLFHAVRTQTEEIVFAALGCGEGTFWFLDDFDPARLAYHHRVSAQELLLESVRRLDEAKYFRDRVTQRPRANTPEALVDLYNQAMRVILASADAAGRGGDIRAQLARFASGVGVYDALFASAGPRADGSLEAARVAHNLQALSGDDPSAALSLWLHDYVSFAFFDATTEMTKSDAQRLWERVSHAIGALAPIRSGTSIAPMAVSERSKPPPSKPSTAPPIARPRPLQAFDPFADVPSPPAPQLPPLDVIAPVAPAPSESPLPKTTQMAMAPLPSIFAEPARDAMPMPLFTTAMSATSTAREEVARAKKPRGRRAVWMVAALLVVAALAGAALARMRSTPEETAAEPVKAAPKPKPASTIANATTASASGTMASATVAVAPVASAPVASVAPPASIASVPGGMGRIVPKSPAGFRLFIDNKVMGNTPDPVVVLCGTRSVKIGSHGATQSVVVPCGGEVEVYAK